MSREEEYLRAFKIVGGFWLAVAITIFLAMVALGIFVVLVGLE